MVSSEKNPPSPGKGEKDENIVLKKLMKLMLINAMFVGTFNVKKYISPLKKYQYMVRVEKAFNKDNYDKFTQDLKLVREYIKQQMALTNVWIGFEETEGGWVIWSDLLDMPFGNQQCRIQEVRVSDTEVRIGLACTGAVVENVSISVEPQTLKRFEQPINETIKRDIKTVLFEYCKSIFDDLCALFEAIWHSKATEFVNYVGVSIVKVIIFLFSCLCIMCYILHLLYHLERKYSSKETCKKSYNLDVDSGCWVCNFKAIFKKTIKYIKHNNQSDRSLQRKRSAKKVENQDHVNEKFKCSNCSRIVNINTNDYNQRPFDERTTSRNGFSDRRTKADQTIPLARSVTNGIRVGNSDDGINTRNLKKQYVKGNYRICYDCGHVFDNHFSLRRHREIHHNTQRQNIRTRA